MNNLNNIAYLTHYDLDGAVSEIVFRKFWKKFPTTNIDSYACGYGRIDSWIEKVVSKQPKYDGIYITDISLTKEQLSMLESINVPMVVIDHHPQTKLLDRYNWSTYIKYDEKMCGAELTLSHFLKLYQDVDDIKYLTEVAGVYDLWKTDSNLWNRAFTINMLYWNLGHHKFVKAFETGWRKFTDDEKRMVEESFKRKKYLMNESETYEIDNTLIAICDREITNDFTIMKKWGHINIFIIINYDEQRGYFNISLRTRNCNIDLNKCVKKVEHELVISTGGHKNAAGISMSQRATLQDCLEIAEIANKILTKEVVKSNENV